MFGLLFRKLKYFLDLLSGSKPTHHQPQTGEQEYFSRNLDRNLSILRRILGESLDIIIRRFTIGNPINLRAAIVFVDGMVNREQINNEILRPLLVDTRKLALTIKIQPDLNSIESRFLTTGSVKRGERVSDAVDGILAGDTVLLTEGFCGFLIIDTKGWEKRSIEEPPSQVVVRGPREGFTESLRTNTAMLRRKIHSPNLIFENMKIGKRTKTDVCIAYLKGVCHNELVDEVKRRLQRIDTDSILESGYIEELIEDAPLSPFPTVANTERPDMVAGRLLEGRAAILINGTPFVLTVPTLFLEFFQNPEDYFSRYFYSSLIRIIRFTAFGFNLLSPAIYVAVTSFHQEIIPTPLLITVAASREGLPFPAVIEAIGMGLIFEILKEAGIRLPRPIGQAVSIVGALVIGQTAVSAGLIGAPLVIVVALTAITSFVTPALSDLSAIFRLVLTLLAGFLGAFGILAGLIGILIHLTTLRSFGVPYLAPFAPYVRSDLKDTVIRAPWWKMWRRPAKIGQEDPLRQEFDLRPAPPNGQSNQTED